MTLENMSMSKFVLIYLKVFAERYRMKFIIKEEVGVTACATDDSDVDEEEDDEVTHSS